MTEWHVPTQPDYHYRAKVVHIIDGDTAWCDVDVGFHSIRRTDFRFHGINAPEKSPDHAAWRAATDRVNQLMPEGSEVIVVSTGIGKFGRWLGEFYPIAADGSVATKSVNQTLLDEGLAVAYDP